MMTILRPYIARALLALVLLLTAAPARGQARPDALEPIQYTFRVIDAGQHLAGVEARVPTGGRRTIDLMMPVWTPGSYLIREYARNIQDMRAESPSGEALDLVKVSKNTWALDGTKDGFVLTYLVFANELVRRNTAARRDGPERARVRHLRAVRRLMARFVQFRRLARVNDDYHMEVAIPHVAKERRWQSRLLQQLFRVQNGSAQFRNGHADVSNVPCAARAQR